MVLSLVQVPAGGEAELLDRLLELGAHVVEAFRELGQLEGPGDGDALREVEPGHGGEVQLTERAVQSPDGVSEQHLLVEGGHNHAEGGSQAHVDGRNVRAGVAIMRNGAGEDAEHHGDAALARERCHVRGAAGAGLQPVA